MLNKILQLLSISCSHKNTTQPFAAAAPQRAASNGDWDPVRPSGYHYVVCLDCGRKFNYDWSKMRILYNEPAGARQV